MAVTERIGIVLVVSLIGLVMMAQTAGTGSNQNNSPIAIEETGVATSYEAMKNITCGNIEWRVNWKSGPGGGQIRGDVTVLIAGKSKALPEAQAQIFQKFATIDNISATCNSGAEGRATRSSLLVSGLSLEKNRKALAQLHVDPDFEAEYSFDAAD